jgi:hypothetical protein
MMQKQLRRPRLVFGQIFSGGQSSSMGTMPSVGMVLALLLGTNSLAMGQNITSPLGSNSSSIVGGVGVTAPRTPPSLFSGSQDSTARVHPGPYGKPCVSVSGYVRPQLINDNIFDHIITANNDCSQPIKIHVCYYQSQYCTLIEVPPYGRKEALLGIMPAMKEFRFEYKEQFDQGSIFGGAGTRPY